MSADSPTELIESLAEQAHDEWLYRACETSDNPVLVETAKDLRRLKHAFDSLRRSLEPTN
jgi:hypothetical protein